MDTGYRATLSRIAGDRETPVSLFTLPGILEASTGDECDRLSETLRYSISHNLSDQALSALAALYDELISSSDVELMKKVAQHAQCTHKMSKVRSHSPELTYLVLSLSHALSKSCPISPQGLPLPMMYVGGNERINKLLLWKSMQYSYNFVPSHEIATRFGGFSILIDWDRLRYKLCELTVPQICYLLPEGCFDALNSMKEISDWQLSVRHLPNEGFKGHTLMLCIFIKYVNTLNIWKFVDNIRDHVVMRAIQFLTGKIWKSRELRKVLYENQFFDTIDRISTFLTTAPTRHRIVDFFIQYLTGSLASLIPVRSRYDVRTFFNSNRGYLFKWHQFMSTLLDTITEQCCVPNERSRYWVRLYVCFVMSCPQIISDREGTCKFIADQIATKRPIDAFILVHYLLRLSVDMREFIAEGGFASLFHWSMSIETLQNLNQEERKYLDANGGLSQVVNYVISKLADVKNLNHITLSRDMMFIESLSSGVNRLTPDFDSLLTRFAPEALRVQPYYEKYLNIPEFVALVDKEKKNVMFDQRLVQLNQLSCLKSFYTAKWLASQGIDYGRILLGEVPKTTTIIPNCVTINNDQKIDIFTPLSFLQPLGETITISGMSRNHETKLLIPTTAARFDFIEKLLGEFNGGRVSVNAAVSECVLALCKHPIYLLTCGVPKDLMLIVEKIPLAISTTARLSMVHMFAFGPEHPILQVQNTVPLVDFEIDNNYNAIHEYDGLLALLGAAQGLVLFANQLMEWDKTREAWDKICFDLAEICLDSNGYPREEADMTALGAIIAYHLKHGLKMNISFHACFWKMILYTQLPFDSNKWFDMLCDFDEEYAKQSDPMAESLRERCLSKMRFDMRSFLNGFCSVGNFEMCCRLLVEPSEWWTLLQVTPPPITLRG